MSLSKIESALLQHFIAGAHFDSVKISYENTSFTAPDSEPWCQVSFLPNLPSVASLGPGGRDETDGIMQIDLNYPLSTGNGASREKFEEIRARFLAGTKLTFLSQEVVIVNCGKNNGRIVSGFFKTSISVQWYAQITR